MVASNTKLFLPAKGTLTANTTGLILGRPDLRMVRPLIFAAWGGGGSNFGGGTVKLQIGFTVDGVNYKFFDLGSGTSFTTDGFSTFNITCDVLQIVLSGATTPTINYVVE